MSFCSAIVTGLSLVVVSTCLKEVRGQLWNSNLCYYYNDPWLKPFTSPQVLQTNDGAGPQSLISNTGCPTKQPFNIIAYNRNKGFKRSAPMGVLISYGSEMLFSTAWGFAFKVESSSFSTINCGWFLSGYKRTYYCRCGAAAYCFYNPTGFFVRLSMSNGASRIEVYKWFKAGRCHRGMCIKPRFCGTGFCPNSFLQKTTESKNMIKDVDEYLAKNGQSGRLTKFETTGTTVKTLSKSQIRKLEVITAGKGKFGKCENSKDWNAEAQLKAAIGVAEESGGSEGAGLSAALDNCEAGLGEHLTPQARAKIQG